MKKKLLKQIQILIKDCPVNWKTEAAKKMETSNEAVRLISIGMIGKKNLNRQFQLIEVLKVIKENYQTELQQKMKKAIS